MDESTGLRRFLAPVTTGALIVIPVIILMLETPLINAFQAQPDPEINEAIDALRSGAAYFECRPPFVRNFDGARRGEASCLVAEGEHVLRITTTPASSPDDPADAFFRFSFDRRYAQRFQGRSIQVNLTAACTGCERPVLMRFDPAPGHSGDWQRIDFGPVQSSHMYSVTVGPMDTDAITDGPRVQIRFIAPQGAQLDIRSIAIYESGDV